MPGRHLFRPKKCNQLAHLLPAPTSGMSAEVRDVMLGPAAAFSLPKELLLLCCRCNVAPFGGLLPNLYDARPARPSCAELASRRSSSSRDSFIPRRGFGEPFICKKLALPGMSVMLLLGTWCCGDGRELTMACGHVMLIKVTSEAQDNNFDAKSKELIYARKVGFVPPNLLGALATLCGPSSNCTVDVCDAVASAEPSRIDLVHSQSMQASFELAVVGLAWRGYYGIGEPR